MWPNNIFDASVRLFLDEIRYQIGGKQLPFLMWIGHIQVKAWMEQKTLASHEQEGLWQLALELNYNIGSFLGLRADRLCTWSVVLLPFCISNLLAHHTDFALARLHNTHSSVLAWTIPGTGEPGGLLSMGSHRVGHDWSDLAAASIMMWINFLK